MSFNKLTFFTLFSFLATGSVYASGDTNATEVFKIPLTDGLALPITNSIITSWVISLILIILIRCAVKVPQLNPGRGQAFVEIILEGIENLIGPIVGKHMVKPTFWLLSGIFLFILINNWSGLIPGVGTIGLVQGDHVVYIRPGNADLNMTLALALVSMTAWVFYILKFAGPKLVIKDLFGNKANKNDVPGALYYFIGVIFLGVGLIEVVSILFRPVSLSFRLFGNVFGGESLLHAMSAMQMWVLPIPFYFLELLFGFIQALVFTLLVSVYIGLICNHDSEEGEHHE